MNTGAVQEARAVRLAPWLGLLMAAFALRVAGQLAVVAAAPAWLPPMRAWQSGVLPYPVLLASQIAILGVGTAIVLQFRRGAGALVVVRPRLGRAARPFGTLYVLAMVARAGLRVALVPRERWLDAAIPIAFHLVLASFVLVFAFHHSAVPQVRRA